MTLEEFKEEYSGAPLSLEDLADVAEEVTDAPTLQKTAKDFLNAMDFFESALETAGVERG